MTQSEDIRAGGSDIVLLSCKYKEELHVFSVDANGRLDDLLRVVARRWEDLKINTFEICYLALTENLYMTLCTDDDVGLMCQMHFLLNKTIANDIVVLKEHTNHDLSSNWTTTSTVEVDINGGHVLDAVNASEALKGAIIGDNQFFENAK